MGKVRTLKIDDSISKKLPLTHFFFPLTHIALLHSLQVCTSCSISHSFSKSFLYMASWCPGVGVPSRKRRTTIQRHHRLEDLPIHRVPEICGGRFQPTNLDMDETALRARRRLEQKLGYFCSSRSSKVENNNDVKRRPWPFQSNSGGKSCGEVVCAVCLEDFGGEQEVMDLSCSHKYHSKCLVPWLASHPHCPCCRSPVQS